MTLHLRSVADSFGDPSRLRRNVDRTLAAAGERESYSQEFTAASAVIAVRKPLWLGAEIVRQHSKHYRREVLALFLVLAMTPAVAHAQVIGGGGTGPLSGLVTWIQGNVLTAVGTLAIIVVGASMFFMRFHFLTIIAVCCGVWVMFNAQTILGFLQQ